MKKFLLFLLVFTATLQAQTIKGKVTDQHTQQSLALVTIVEEGTQNGTYSDIDGYFSIKLINENSNIVFSYLEYETKFLSAEKNILWNVSILPQAINIKEVKILPVENHKKNRQAAIDKLPSTSCHRQAAIDKLRQLR
jgi:hypothetical protein